MIVTYDFYKNTYGGENVETEAVFNKFERQAEVELGMMTFGNIVLLDGAYGTEQGGQFEEYTDAELAELQFGVCSLIDTLKTLDDLRANVISSTTGETSGTVKSRTSGGESISYEIKQTMFDEALRNDDEKKKLLKRMFCSFCNIHTFKYNPFYAGLN